MVLSVDLNNVRNFIIYENWSCVNIYFELNWAFRINKIFWSWSKRAITKCNKCIDGNSLRELVKYANTHILVPSFGFPNSLLAPRYHQSQCRCYCVERIRLIYSLHFVVVGGCMVWCSCKCIMFSVGRTSPLRRHHHSSFMSTMMVILTAHSLLYTLRISDSRHIYSPNFNITKNFNAACVNFRSFDTTPPEEHSTSLHVWP